LFLLALLDISEEAAERLDLLKESTIGGNRSACIRQPLQLFEYVVERTVEGDSLFVGKDKEAAVELKLLGLV
jgi:hypothetical protein